jgi:hypothetical protein
MLYTEKQFTEALTIYYKKMHENPDDFYTGVSTDFEGAAKETVVLLIKILETL